jgi:hypothetical protein
VLIHGKKKMKTFKQFRERVIPVSMIDHGYERQIPFDICEHGDERQIPFDICEHGDDRHLMVEGLISKWANTSGSPIDETHPDLQKQHHDNFTHDDKDSIGRYVMGGLYAHQGTGSAPLNKHLIKSHEDNHESPSSFTIRGEHGRSDVHYDLDKLDEATNRNKLKEPLTTYSGFKHNPSPKTSDGVTYFPAYTSSSPNKHIALKYAHPVDGIRHIMKIDHGVGHTGAYIGNNQNITPFYDDEFIMPRNTHLKINPVPEEHENSHGEKFHVWSAKRLT